MTFSIVARSEDGTELGVAVASKFLAVGAAVPAARSAQAPSRPRRWPNLAYRPKGLALLAAGGAAHDVLTTLLSEDGEHEHRQAGGRRRPRRRRELHRRRVPCLGRWHQRVTRAGRRTPCRATSSPDRTSSTCASTTTPTRCPSSSGCSGPRPALRAARPRGCLPLEGEVADEVRRRLAALGHTGFDLTTALSSWAGGENLEERRVPGRIDPLVLDHLRALTSDGSTGGHA